MSEKKEKNQREQRPWLKIIQGYNKPNLVKSWGQDKHKKHTDFSS